MKERVRIALFSSSLISEDDLVLRCAEIAKNSGFELIIIAQSPRIKSWAQQHNTPFFEPPSLAKKNPITSVDYLFSIAPLQYFLHYCSSIPTTIFHYGNSLFSEYSKYAYTKAILENKETHGIFWGIRSPTDPTALYSIIKQASFSVGINETAFSLRQKCQKHAVFEFLSIIEEIKHKKFHFSEQPLKTLNQPLSNSLETIFKRTFIHWDTSAEEIERLHRALNFEDQGNPIGLIKLSLGEKILSVRSVKILESSSKAIPGTVLSISKDELHVATTTQDISIKDFYSSNGSPFSVKKLINHYKIAKGYRLSNPDYLFIKEFAHKASACIQYETFWVTALTNIIPGMPPLSINTKRTEKIKPEMVGFLKLEGPLFTQLIDIYQKKENESSMDIHESKRYYPILLTLILIYLYRLNNYQEYTIKFSDQETQNKDILRNFFASYLPLTINFDSKMSFMNALEETSFALHQLKENKTYARDMRLRYTSFTMESTADLISILISDNINSPKLAGTGALTLIINQKGTEFALYAKKGTFPNYLDTLIYSFSTHILTMITNIVKQLHTPINKLSMLTNTEIQKTLLDWNNTKVNFKDSHKPIHCLFEEQVLKTPHRIAVTFENKSLTYSELNAKSDQIAQYLTNLGVVPNAIIAICAKRSLEMVMGILGILKAGGAYLPLDPNYPTDRLNFMLSDSKAFLLLTDTLYPSIRSNKNINTIKIQQIFSRINIEEDIKTKNAISSKNLAYVIYTSGTTGNPKGVAVTHASLVNHMLWMIPKFNFTEHDIFLQKTPFSFDASIWEFFAPLLCGGKLVMAPEDLTELTTVIKSHKVTILQLVPSMLKELLQEQEFQQCDSLQQVFSGGEALLPNTVNSFFKKMRAKLCNLYGPTETTIQVTTCNYENIYERSSTNILIGKPIDNVQVYVLDKYLNPMPIGAVGELYIGGLCLAKGYLNREDLTKERFVQNPFDVHNSEQLYKTGDIVRWSVDGNLEYISRTDDQLKFNGFRIEIAEIEAHLLKHESIRECAVVIQESVDHKGNLNGIKYLAAYYVKNLDLTHSNIENFIRMWETTHQSEYSSLETDNFKQNTKGWISSYTNKAIEQEGILEWINATTDRIKQLKPNVVLEIGSGSGLILFNILDNCHHYYATDLSKNVIDYTNNVVHKFGFDTKVSTFVCAAGEVPYEQLEKGYDTVVINSVIQYFPSLKYLETIITNAILNMQDSGQIFIGDIRDFRLLKCFHYSVQTFKHGKTTKAEIDYFSLRDKELLVAPEYFVHLKTMNKDIAYVEILPKCGKANHEMNNYRYDVVLHIRKNNNKIESHNEIWMNESDFVKTPSVKNYITAHLDKDYICIKYLNKRIAKDYIEYNKAYDNGYRADVLEYHKKLLSIHEIAEFSSTKDRNIKCFIDICDPLYLYIVIFKNHTNAPKNFFIDYVFRKSISKSDLANKPLVTLKLLENQFSNDLKEYLSNTLPSYMIPQRFIPLEKLPLNSNGKLDKKALVEPEFTPQGNYVAPRNEIEAKIRRIWAEVLGLSEEKIGIQDDFFNLGGHSLSALRTLSLTRSSFLIKLPTRALFDYPTIEKLAKLIQRIQQDLSFNTRKKFMVSPVITFQKNGFKAPIFLIHPIGGTTFWYKLLSRYLGTNRPVHAIQDPGIDANDFLFEDIKEMANFYMKAIQNIQPSGPYLLAGASFGATVAMEIANQLLRSEEKVNFIGLLDGWPVYSEKFWEKEFFERLMLQQFQRIDPKLINQDINNVHFIQFLLKLQKHRMTMLRFYKIPLIKAKLTFFQAQELWPVFKKIALPTNCWQPYSTKPVEIHKVPGNHETMFWEPHVQILAKKINQSLNKIENNE